MPSIRAYTYCFIKVIHCVFELAENLRIVCIWENSRLANTAKHGSQGYKILKMASDIIPRMWIDQSTLVDCLHRNLHNVIIIL